MRSKMAGPVFKPYVVLFLLVFGYSMFVLHCGVKKKGNILKPTPPKLVN